MNISTPSSRNNLLSLFLGFTILFAVYHFHEFYQSMTVSAITLLSFMVVSHFVARAQKLEGIKSWGLGLQDRWWLKLLMGLALGVIFVSLSSLAASYFGYEKTTASPGWQVFFQKIWWLVFMTFWPSLAEDILTRGYLYRHLSHRMPAYLWVLLSATVYVLNHIWRLTDHPAVLTYLFILGLVLGVAVVLTKSLWLALGIHWGANIVYFVTVDILAVESIVDGRQSTWVLAAVYLLLLLVLLSFAAFRKHREQRVQNPALI